MVFPPRHTVHRLWKARHPVRPTPWARRARRLCRSLPVNLVFVQVHRFGEDLCFGYQPGFVISVSRQLTPSQTDSYEQFPDSQDLSMMGKGEWPLQLRSWELGKALQTRFPPTHR